MKKINIMLICGSPRKGNCEAVLTQVEKYLKKSGAETNLLLLRQKNINRCQGCVEFCNQKLYCKKDDNDDMGKILKQMAETDGFVFASPTYFSMPSGLFKDFIDRSSILFTKGVDLSQKAFSVIGIGTDLPSIGGNVQNLMTYGHVHGMILVDSLCLIGQSNLFKNYNHILTSQANGDLQSKLKKLAQRLYQTCQKLNK